jgi:hypothetical protein
MLPQDHSQKVAELARAQTLAEMNKEAIVQKWHEYFN